MTLKDWKLEGNSYLKYKNNKIISEILFSQNIIWGHYELYFDIENKRPYTRKFKTEKQALAYAKSYMRKH